MTSTTNETGLIPNNLEEDHNPAVEKVIEIAEWVFMFGSIITNSFFFAPKGLLITTALSLKPVTNLFKKTMVLYETVDEVRKNKHFFSYFEKIVIM